jgi:hypothetical protein
MVPDPMDQPTDEYIPAGDPRYDGFRITELWAWTFIDPSDDQEGIATLLHRDNVLPLIGSDRRRIESFRGYAQRLANDLGIQITLVKFTTREKVETLDPLG